MFSRKRRVCSNPPKCWPKAAHRLYSNPSNKPHQTGAWLRVVLKQNNPREKQVVHVKKCSTVFWVIGPLIVWGELTNCQHSQIAGITSSHLGMRVAAFPRPAG